MGGNFRDEPKDPRPGRDEPSYDLVMRPAKFVVCSAEGRRPLIMTVDACWSIINLLAMRRVDAATRRMLSQWKVDSS